MKKIKNYLVLILMTLLLVGCTEVEEPSKEKVETSTKEEVVVPENKLDETDESISTDRDEPIAEVKEEEVENTSVQATNNVFAGYNLIAVDACNLSGNRKANAVVNIGYGDREYWAFTNEHGQLVRVIADKITLQNDNAESVTSSGRYCSDEAKVPGVESDVLDEGHVIADSLGGVSNAYNITPQDSTLNRHGDQAYMEKVIRDAGGATNFEAIITYPNTKTQIPSKYQYTYTVKGNTVVDTFDNVNPDNVNQSLGLTDKETNKPTKPTAPNANGGDISSVDTNGNGQVTIKEAKDAGFKMPITSDHWLYPYMDDRDGDGMVGE